MPRRKANTFAAVRPASTWCLGRKPCIACRKCSTTCRAPAAPSSTSASRKSKNSIACRNRVPKALPPSSPSWKAATSTVPSAWCLIPAVKKSAAQAMTSCLKSPNWRRRAYAKSTCSARTSTPIAARLTTAKFARLPNCCAWWRPSTVSTASVSPPAIRLNSPTISSRFMKTHRSW
ncbi:hypothetical protein D3C72_1587230 [compost metagenome]